MSAGLPGLGLGGLLFIFSALLAPFRQLWLTARGRGRADDWPKVGRQFAQAVLMVAAIDLTLRLAYLMLDATGLGEPRSASSGTALPLTLIGITTGLLVVVLSIAKLSELALRLRGAELPRVPAVLPRPTPVRAVAFGGAAALAWFALLAGGASELSPLMDPDREARVEGRAAEPPRQRGGRPSEVPPGGGSTPTPAAGAAAPPTPTPRPGSGEEGPARPSPSEAAPDGGQPTAPRRPSEPTPRSVAPSPAPGRGAEPEARSPGAPAPPSAGRPEAKGPPPTAGPKEGSPAPEHAGPPPHAGPGG